MPVYIVVPLIASNLPLDEAVKKKISSPAHRYRLQDSRGWLIQYEGTTVELSNHLGITGQAEGAISLVGPAIVIPVSGYYGRGPADMWEWLKVRLEQ